MGLKNFSIVLDSPTGAFYAGTMISGKVFLCLDKPKTIRAINLKIEGQAKVSFSEHESVRKSDGDSKMETVHYSSEEEYFSTKFKLAGKGTGETEIPIGEYAYPFSYTLPPLLPSSFEGEYGSIRYSVKAVIDRPWKFDHETKVSFIVVAPLDLNYNANAKEPVKVEDEKTFCCFCCQSGPLQLVVSLPHTGFVAGQQIPLTIEVDNASNVEVDHIICKLKKEMKWTAHSPKQKVKHEKDELVKLSLEGVGCNGSKSWTQQVTIPQDMPFVNLDLCSIIQSEILLKVMAEVSGCHGDLEIEIPLIIGSVAIGSGPPPALPAPGGVTVPVPGSPPGFSPAVTPSQPGFAVPTNPPQQYYPSPGSAPYPGVPPFPPGSDQQPPGINNFQQAPAPSYLCPGNSPAMNSPSSYTPSSFPSAHGPAPYPPSNNTSYSNAGQPPTAPVATYSGNPSPSATPYPPPGPPTPTPYPPSSQSSYPSSPSAPYQTGHPTSTAPYPPPSTSPYTNSTPYPRTDQPLAASPYSSTSGNSYSPQGQENAAPSAPTMPLSGAYPPTSESTPLMGQPT